MSSAQKRSPLGLECGHLAQIRGNRPGKGTTVWCYSCQDISPVARVYPSPRRICGATGLGTASVTLHLCCTLPPGHDGELHHDELAGADFPRRGRLRSGVEGNTGRRP